MEIKAYDEIFNDMKNYIIAHQDRLTDFNNGSVLSSQVEAVAREIALVYVRCRVGYSVFMRSLPYSVFNFLQKKGIKASSKVIFSRARPLPYETRIPAGTIVASGVLQFLTVEEIFIENNEKDSPLVSVIAESEGYKYNLSASTIKKIVSALTSDVIAVNNPEETTGGIDAESSSEYMARFAQYILGLQRTNAAGFLSGLTVGNTIRSFTIKEHFPPLDDIWNVTLCLEDGSGGMRPDAMAEAKKIMDGDISSNIGGYRPPGISIRYTVPEIVEISISVAVYVNDDIANEANESIISEDTINSVRRFVNNLKIGESLLRSSLMVALRRLEDIKNVKILFPEDDIEINNEQIARFGNCDVEVVI